MARHTTAGLLVLLLLLVACASSSPPAEGEGEAKQAAPKGVAPPPDSPLAKASLGMPAEEVRRLVGEPTSTQTYMTGKAFMPWYFGSDTHRTDYKYKGMGRVVFGHNRWSGSTKVIRVDYDPTEDGL